ncbi:MAG: hypothetical protein ABWY04_19575, partial [Arthrobacter sp.]
MGADNTVEKGASPPLWVELLKIGVSAAAVVVAAIAILGPFWESQETAKQNAKAASYTQRADLYRGYLGAATDFDI